jgi:hypothetical protein
MNTVSFSTPAVFTKRVPLVLLKMDLECISTYAGYLYIVR